MKLSLGNNVGIILRLGITSIVHSLSGGGRSRGFGGTLSLTCRGRTADRGSFVSLFTRRCGGLSGNTHLSTVFDAFRLGSGVAPRDSSTRMVTILGRRLGDTVSGSFGMLHAHVSHFNIISPGVRHLRATNHVLIRLPNIGRPRHIHGLLRNDTGLRF